MSPAGSSTPPPEERLLRLIRGKGGGAGQAPPQAAAAPAGPEGVRALAVKPLRARERFPWTTMAIAGLGLMLGVELVYLVLQMQRPLPVIAAPALPPPPTPPAAEGKTPALELPSLTASASTQLFATPVEAAPAAAVKSAPSEAAKQLAARLSLLGIVAGDSPQAIVEDSQTKKTYFVATGQAVSEGATVEQVLENRVILDLGGEKIELTL